MQWAAKGEDNSPDKEGCYSDERQVDVVENISTPRIPFVGACKGVVLTALGDLVIHYSGPKQA